MTRIIPWMRGVVFPAVARSSRLYSARGGHAKRSLSTKNTSIYRISEEVRQAIAERRPVVALESTIYTHGFPYPDNLALSSRLESLVRENGGVPATIGILDGVARVGLDGEDLERLVTSAHDDPSSLLKVSRRDLAFATALTGTQGQRLNGGTTVSATMILAHMAGIRVFATGGLGGVHRGAESTLDVSADLTELGRTPVAVISSGCKAFLDIPKTLEYLETQGVAVATFADGRISKDIDFPAFWSRDSGVRSPMIVRDEAEAARVIYSHGLLGLQSGLHFANPIPEEHSIPHTKMEAAIYQALNQAASAGATGARSTPFILAKIKELTKGESGKVNQILVEGNVIRGTKVAVELGRMERGQHSGSEHDETLTAGQRALEYTSTGVTLGVNQITTKRSAHVISVLAENPARDFLPEILDDKAAIVFVAGSLNVDLSCDFSPRHTSSASTPELQTSNPAIIAQSLGGVGHNVARAVHLMGANVRLCSAVGDDLSGKAALDALAASGMPVGGVKTLATGRTSQYIAINDVNKDLVLAMADVSILEQALPITSTLEEYWLPQLRASKPTHLVLDANWPPQHLGSWLTAGKEVGAHITFEPVSNIKATSLFQLPSALHTLSVYPHASVHLATPNTTELSSLAQAARDAGAFDRDDHWAVLDALGIPSTGARVGMAMATTSALVDEGIPQQSVQLLPFIPCILTKLGARGVLLTQLLAAGDTRLSSGEHAPYILSRCTNGTEESLGVGGIYMRLFPAVEEVSSEDVVSVNGVGDTFAGTLIAGLANRGQSARVEDLVDLAQRAAVLTLKSGESVSPGLGTLRMLL